ncbi:MAG: alkaline phosphatase family protein [Lentisphaeria bacterium]|nr:alkaline phosphatase family protein [Lentisphaeria bacterium]
MPEPRKLLLVQCAGLGYQLVERHRSRLAGIGLTFDPCQAVFPAVTCPAQATMRTALPPARHGIVANGRFDRQTRRVDFWQQSARLVQGERIWARGRHQGQTSAMLFHQQNLGEDVDYLVSPAPIHRHHGGMLQACQTRPPELEDWLNAAVGKPFNLADYWGPGANRKSTQWITTATRAIIQKYEPDILLTYLPHLDYCQQCHGPDNDRLIGPEVTVLADCLQLLVMAADKYGYDLMVWGDYAITPASRPVFPNHTLREAGLFHCRRVSGRLYPDLHDSRAFALCDHQIAHVFINQPGDLPRVRELLAALPGVAQACPPTDIDLGHPESGELVLTAEPGAWFAYPWWDSNREAPDYASHVDIHNKIGFDPCELFWKIPLISTSTDCRRPKGTHGRTDQPAAVAVSDGLAGTRALPSLLEKSQFLKKRLHQSTNKPDAPVEDSR